MHIYITFNPAVVENLNNFIHKYSQIIIIQCLPMLNLNVLGVKNTRYFFEKSYREREREREREK